MKAAHISGRLGRDIEVNTTQSGTSVANFDLAVDGYDYHLKEKKTVWIPCVVWGQTADFLGEHANKGDGVVVKGELDEQTWESKKFFDADGNPATMKKTVVKADMGGVELYKRGASDGSQRSLADAVSNPKADDFKDIDFGGEDLPF